MLLDLNTEPVDLGIVNQVELGAGTAVNLPRYSLVDLGLAKPEPQPDAILPDGRLRVEADAEKELTDVEQKFADLFKQQRDSFVNATDSFYYVNVCFQNRAQLVEWLTKSGLMDKLDGSQYIDGKHVAARMGITIEAPANAPTRKREDRRLAGLLENA